MPSFTIFIKVLGVWHFTSHRHYPDCTRLDSKNLGNVCEK